MTPFAKLQSSDFESPNESKEQMEKINKSEQSVGQSLACQQPKGTTTENVKIPTFDFEELKQYQKRVERFASEGSDFLFPNSNCYHAAIVISKIVEYAKTTVRIYDDSLRGDISGEYDVFGQFIDLLIEHVKKPGAVLEIVVRDKSNQDSEIYSLLREEVVVKGNPNISVKEASPAFKAKVLSSFNGKDYNFAVGDEKAFRLEEYVENVEVRKAICSFHNPEYSNTINSIFLSEEFKSCKSIF